MLQSTIANRPELKPDLKILGRVPATRRVPLKRPLKLARAIHATPLPSEPPPAPRPTVRTAPVIEQPAPAAAPKSTATPVRKRSTSPLERLPFGLGRLFAKA